MVFDRKMLKNGINYKRIILTLALMVLVIWFFVFVIKKIIGNSSKDGRFDPKSPIDALVKNEEKSIFNIKELNSKELRGRIILLNVYNIKDFSYLFSIDLVNRLENKYKNKIVAIDVITNNYDLDDNTIINYIIKNNIERPVINISNFDLGNELRTDDDYFLLINRNGKVANSFSFEDANEENISKAIDELIDESPKSIKKDKLDVELEKSKNPEFFIKSLNHIKYINRINKTKDGPYFVISDAKGKKIYLMRINGVIVNQFGSGKKGNADGMGVNATFCYPSGIAIGQNEYVYVADICNNSIRKINLKTSEVSTVIANNDLLKNPMDIEVLDNNLIITSASDNPILSYNLKTGKIKNLGCDNCGKYVIKLVKYNNKIHFTNMNDYGLYSIDKDGKINKEIDFNELNEKNDVNIEGNNKFHMDETGLYIVDKFRNRILKIRDSKVNVYSTNGEKDIYNLPTDLVDVKDKLYITNENDKKLVQLDKNTKKTKVVDISFGYEYNKIKNIPDEFLNVNNLKEIEIKNGDGNLVELKLENGYSFEEMAPQSLMLFKEDRKNNSAIMIKTYTKNEILENDVLELPELDNGAVYYLKGNFYYCNYSKKTPCLVNKYNRKIVVSKSSKNDKIIIKFLYQ